MKTHIVAYMTESKEDGFTDHYLVFPNKNKAKKKYKKLLKQEDVYTVNLCKLKKTTEHYE